MLSETDEDTFIVKLFQNKLLKILDSSFTVTQLILTAPQQLFCSVNTKGKIERSTDEQQPKVSAEKL